MGGGRAGLGVGQKSAVPTADPLFLATPQNQSREFEISNLHTMNKIVFLDTSDPLDPMLLWARKSAGLQGATDRRTPAGT